MKRLLFYCQHLLGVGHLTRSIALCEELKKEFQIDFIQGGPDVGLSQSDTHVKFHFLHPFMMDATTEQYYDPEGQLSVEEIWEARSQQLRDFAGEHYDVIVVELFPFGRNKFKQEILGLLEQCRTPGTRVYCSLRDIVMPVGDPEERNRKNADILNTYFDGILIHSDPNFIGLADSYTGEHLIDTKIHYTGFVARKIQSLRTVEKQEFNRAVSKQKKIVVSAGGSLVGLDFIKRVLEAAKTIQNHRWHFYIPPKAFAEIQDFAARLFDQERLSSVHGGTTQSISFEEGFALELRAFSNHFLTDLHSSDLSISMAGYNTVAEVLSAGCRALLAPYPGNPEQGIRAEALSKSSRVQVLRGNHPDGENIAENIAGMIEASQSLNLQQIPLLDGAKRSCEIILSELSSKNL